jgi:hypothetical protein
VEEGIADENDTLRFLLRRSKSRSGLTLRHAFVHHPEAGGGPGPLKAFLRRDDALDLYLLILLVGRGGSGTVTFPLATWSRAVGRGDGEGAELWASKTITFIEQQGLLTSRKSGRLRELEVLDDAGRRIPYTRPTGKGGCWEWFVVLPLAYWEQGWHRELSLRAKATLLVCLSRRPQFELPLRQSAQWYGLSEETLGQGLQELRDVGLLATREIRKKAPELRAGYTLARMHSLTGPFKRGRRSADAAAAG